MGRDIYGWTGDGRVNKKKVGVKKKKKFSKTTDIVCYALQVSVNGVTCVCSPFQVFRHILKFVNWLNS